MSDFNEAKTFLDKTNCCHENLKFTLEVAEHNTISFGGMNITKRGKRLEPSVHRKCTNTSVLLLYHRHVDKRYKDCLLTTMNHRAYCLSSTPTAFSDACNKLRSTFLKLDYPINVINSLIDKFLYNIDNIDASKDTNDDSPTMQLPFKDQQSANSVKRQMQNLSADLSVQIKPVFQTKKTDWSSPLHDRERSTLLLIINRRGLQI